MKTPTKELTGMPWVIKQLGDHFAKVGGNGKPVKRERLHDGVLVKLPKNWKEKFWREKTMGNPPEWLEKITHGKIKGRVVNNDLTDAGQYWVQLRKANDAWTNHTIFVDEWELSLAQKETE